MLPEESLKFIYYSERLFTKIYITLLSVVKLSVFVDLVEYLGTQDLLGLVELFKLEVADFLVCEVTSEGEEGSVIDAVVTHSVEQEITESVVPCVNSDGVIVVDDEKVIELEKLDMVEVRSSMSFSVVDDKDLHPALYGQSHTFAIGLKCCPIPQLRRYGLPLEHCQNFEQSSSGKYTESPPSTRGQFPIN